MPIKNTECDRKHSRSEYKAITRCDETEEIASIGDKGIREVFQCKFKEPVADKEINWSSSK